MNAEIIMVTHEFFPRKAGISVYVQEMARCASRMGFKVEVWAPRHPRLENHSFPFPVKQMPVRGTQGWLDRIRLAGFLWCHRKILANKILYLPEPGPLRALMYLQLIPAISWKFLVVTLHGSEILRFSSPLHRRILFKKLLQKADNIGVVSRYCQRLLANKFPQAASRAIVSSGALRSDLIIPPIAEKISEKKIILLTVARITPRKGQLKVLHGLYQLPERLLHQIEYWLVGPARSRNQRSYLWEIERYSSEKGIKLQVWGEIEDQSLGEIYAKADIFVLASALHEKSVEGFGLVCLEASAFGLPIVAFHSGGVEESVLDGETGILVPPGDCEGLAQAIQKLSENPSLRRQLGQKGKEHAARLTWDHNVNVLFQEDIT